MFGGDDFAVCERERSLGLSYLTGEKQPRLSGSNEALPVLAAVGRLR
jgi:hypothetical protein